MSIESINSQLSGQATSNWLSLQNNLSPSELNNPIDMLKIQQWAAEYSIEVQLDSAMIKMMKDLLSGITSKI